jgi:hypothetical protein
MADAPELRVGSQSNWVIRCLHPLMMHVQGVLVAARRSEISARGETQIGKTMGYLQTKVREIQVAVSARIAD